MDKSLLLQILLYLFIFPFKTFLHKCISLLPSYFSCMPHFEIDTKLFLYINPINQYQSRLICKLTKVLLSRPMCNYTVSSNWLGDLLILDINYTTRHRHAFDRGDDLVHTSHFNVVWNSAYTGDSVDTLLLGLHYLMHYLANTVFSITR